MPFHIKSIIVAISIIALLFALHFLKVLIIPTALYFLPIAFAALSILIFRVLSKSNRENPKRFVTSYMGAIGIKLFASLIFLTFYLIFAENSTKIPVVVGLFIVYTIFNVLLLRSLNKEIREQENKGIPK